MDSRFNAYWITLAHLQKTTLEGRRWRWKYREINSLIKQIYEVQHSNIGEFFMMEAEEWRDVYELDEIAIESLLEAKEEVVNNSYLAEKLENFGIEIITALDEEYPPLLKTNLDDNSYPPVLYVKGDKDMLLKTDSIAVVGSRKANPTSLEFTDNIAKKAAQENKIIVSGIAKGVDEKATNSILDYGGKSIVVLAQGILTYESLFQKYYRHIIDANILVLSIFHPLNKWMAWQAMTRNFVIYGLSKDIYIAESGDKGGTWGGAEDGFRRNRVIYIRKPEADENNANNLLIAKGARPVDLHGNPLQLPEHLELKLKRESSFTDNVITLLTDKPLTANQIKESLKLDWSTNKIAQQLKFIDEVTSIGKSPMKYTLKSLKQTDEIALNQQEIDF
ncbi:MAG: DNA-processing protein DprA [Candidatus Cloacimonadia bacterium]